MKNESFVKYDLYNINTVIIFEYKHSIIFGLLIKDKYISENKISSYDHVGGMRSAPVPRQDAPGI